jgi:hypothetical protein
VIKAIETRYKGYRFRSRLEARWAVFFDALGIKWEYEVEGYDLGKAGWYLPDFKLEGPWPVFFEVKAGEPSDQEREKCRQLALAHDGECIIGYEGLFSSQARFDVFAGHSDAIDGILTLNGYIGMDEFVVVWDDNSDGDLDSVQRHGSVHFKGHRGVRTIHDYREPGFGSTPRASWPFFYRWNSQGDVVAVMRELNAAFIAARAARFEHGETP